MIYYVESSAAAKIVAEEAETAALKVFLDTRRDHGDAVVSSFLTETELRRLAERESISQTSVTEALERLDLFELDRMVFRDAGLLPGVGLRSLDALHVAAAARAGADHFVSYDQRQISAARDVGLMTISPN